MPEQTSPPINITDLVMRLMHLGVDAKTIDDVVAYIGRERWYAVREVVMTNNLSIQPTILGFAGQLEEHCDRLHGINIAMIGLREVLGQEKSVIGTQQLTLDVSQDAQDLRRAFSNLLNDFGMGRAI